MSESSVRQFEVPITKNSYAEIRWARLSQNPNSAIRAEFSMDIYVDGELFTTVNSLAIKNAHNKSTGKEEVHIHSMCKQVPGPNRTQKTIYSNTFFPKYWIDDHADDAEKELNADSNESQRIRREKFVSDVVAAVTAFLKYQANYVRKKPVSVNPKLQALEGIRTLFS